MTIEEKLNKLDEYEKLEKQGMLVRLPCPVGATMYRIDSRTRACSYHYNTRDNMYYCINDYKCRHICDGKCDAGVDYNIHSINNADAQAILGNSSLIGTRVFLDKEEAEKELLKKREEERRIMLKVAQKLDWQYKAYYCDYLNDTTEEDD